MKLVLILLVGTVAAASARSLTNDEKKDLYKTMLNIIKKTEGQDPFLFPGMDKKAVEVKATTSTKLQKRQNGSTFEEEVVGRLAQIGHGVEGLAVAPLFSKIIDTFDSLDRICYHVMNFIHEHHDYYDYEEEESSGSAPPVTSPAPPAEASSPPPHPPKSSPPPPPRKSSPPPPPRKSSPPPPPRKSSPPPPPAKSSPPPPPAKSSPPPPPPATDAPEVDEPEVVELEDETETTDLPLVDEPDVHLEDDTEPTEAPEAKKKGYHPTKKELMEDLVRLLKEGSMSKRGNSRQKRNAWWDVDWHLVGHVCKGYEDYKYGGWHYYDYKQ